MVKITDGRNRLQLEMLVHVDDVWSYDYLALTLRNRGITPSTNSGWFTTKSIDKVIKYALNWAYGDTRPHCHRSLVVRYNGKVVM